MSLLLYIWNAPDFQKINLGEGKPEKPQRSYHNEQEIFIYIKSKNCYRRPGY
jgi:hypothetical protein